MDAPDIYTAAIFGKYDRVRAILVANPDAVHTRDKFGFTALHGVAGEDHPEMLRLLTEAGADVNAENNFGHTPLHLATNPDAVRTLIDIGANVNARARDGSTPLHLAAEEPRREKVIEALLEAGAAVNLVNARGETPLQVAIARKETTKIALLRQFGGR